MTRKNSSGKWSTRFRRWRGAACRMVQAITARIVVKRSSLTEYPTSGAGVRTMSRRYLQRSLPSSIRCCENKRKTMPDTTCTHIRAVATVKHPKRRECEECVKIGAEWVHLRTCQECGGTRCCDDSPNKHATKHARASKHPVIASAEPGERWLYCYPDDAFTEY